jgi:ubiquinone/menaquinone biosynthesis C-methylase UbiE
MKLYKNHIYPWLINKLGDPEPIRHLRQEVIPLSEGIVLEIGTGPGTNFIYYNPSKVSKLYALEPNRGMAKYAEHERSKTRLNIEYIDLSGDQIPLPDSSVDTVVSTFTLGTIVSVQEVLQGIHRVLKPCGKFLFCEVGGSPDPFVRRWQDRWKPITRRVFLGLDLTKDIPALIQESGFRIEGIATAYFDETSAASKAWTYCSWGMAKPMHSA